MANKIRLIKFEFNTNQTYMLEFGNLYIRFYNKNGIVMNGNVPLEVVTPYTENDIWNIDFTQKGDTIFLVDGVHKPKELQRLGTTSWQLIDYVNEFGPFNAQDKEIKGYFSYADDKAYIKSDDYTFSANNIGELFQLETYFNAGTIFGLINTTETASAFKNTVILVGSSWSFTTSGTWAGKIHIETSQDGVNWKTFKTISSSIDGDVSSYNASITGDFDDIVFVRINADDLLNPITDHCQITFQSIGFYENISFKVTSFIDTDECEIELEYYPSSIVDYSNCLTSETAEMLQDCAWSETYGYPKHIEFYQDRLVFANNTKSPFTVWATETAGYHSFRIHIDVLASDSISTNVISSGLNEITSLVSLMSLIAFTENGEFRTSIEPMSAIDNFTLSKQSSGGSCVVKPCIIDNSCIYVRPTKDQIRDFYYQYQIDAYAGDQLDILARHLFDNKIIKQIAYQGQEKIIWVLFDDGTMVYCTYMKEQEVLGWNKFETSGTILSISTIMEDGLDVLYLAVERETGTFIEKLDKRLTSKLVKDQIFCDCALVYSGVYANIITGLSHLEGQLVWVLADGSCYQKTVINGEVELNAVAKDVIVGLPYETIVETLDINFNTNDGTTNSLKRKIVGADIYFLDSCQCKAGTSNSEKIDEIILANPVNYNQAIELMTLIKGVNFTTSHDKQTHVIIKQDNPLPITITGIVQKITYGDK